MFTIHPQDLLADVDALQLAQNERMFTKASTLFIKKWAKAQPGFVEYFRSVWLTSHNTWYEGVQHFTPCTNNGLESINRVIKDENTFRERLPLSKFKALVFEIAEKWTKSYERGLKQYNEKQTITLDLWTNAYQWVKSEKSVLSTETNDSIQYYIPAGDETLVTNANIDVVKKMKWYSFDHYKTKAFSVWCVSLPKDTSKWDEGVRNCPAFFKRFMCKHVIGLAIKLNLCKPPPAGKNVPIGQKRCRGRPSKPKKPLLIQ
jgi:hypothetical protein